jgi:zinc protease
MKSPYTKAPHKLLTVLHFALLLLASVVCSTPTKAQAQNTWAKATSKASSKATLPPIHFTQFRLRNGLRVILHEDHSTPIVSVNVWYHVGSKNEVPGRTGFAHLFEHMMFQGSKHHDEDYFKLLQEAGGSINGTTSSDRTNYFETVPANFLELALWLESDRMGYLLDALTEAKLSNQREVVKNEKRQNYDNQPYGLVGAKISETMYPLPHPYHWMTIGSLEDVTGASMDEVKDFFRRYYVPNNASLVIAGDFQPRQARQWVEKYFGPLKRGASIPPVKAPRPQLAREVRLEMEDRVTLPRIYLNWHTVPHYAPDDAALDMLAYVMVNGKGSRLYKSLVYDRQIAQDVSAFNSSRELAGAFSVVATAKPGKTLSELENAINEELARLKATPPSIEEMERAYNTIESSSIYGLQTLRGKADQLNHYATFLNNPGYFQQDLARYRRVTPADVQRVAQSYLTDRRLIVSVSPQTPGRTSTASAPSAGQSPNSTTNAPTSNTPTASQTNNDTKTEAKSGGLYEIPKAQADPRLRLPEIQRSRLSNGLQVLIVEQHELPVVSLNLVIKSGAAADPPNRAGLATLAADILDEGTKSRSALDISNELTAIGARLGTGAGWDSSSASMTTLARHLEKALDIFADVALNPAFSREELERLRARRLASLRQRRDNANAIAETVYASLLYGAGHPYGHSTIGDTTSTEALQSEDLQRFYETYYRPNNAALIVVGDVQSATLLPQLEKAFGSWKSAAVPSTEITIPGPRERSSLYLVDKPGAAQSVITIGQIGVPRSTPDYFPLRVLNTILGGQFMSRLNLNLREDKGYSYGAFSSFDYRRSAGPFSAGAGVQTAVTKESIVEVFKELRGIGEAQPVTAQEVEFAKQTIIRAYPSGFETSGQIAGRLEDLVIHGLPDDYFNKVIEHVRAVTLDDVMRVANQYLKPDKMAVLVVGDRKTIEPGLRALDGVGATLTLLDTEGQRVPDEYP